MPTASFMWYKSDNGIFRTYSGIGAGLALVKEVVTAPGYECDKTPAKWAYNATIIGMEIGGQRLKFFSEFNIGCKGLFTSGMVVRF